MTRLALAQRAHLAGELAGRGLDLRCVVVADDDNLDIAAEFGFDTLELDNRWLGRKINAGFQWARERGSEYAAFIGSDDWLHAELFTPLLEEYDDPPLHSGHKFTVIDLEAAKLRVLGWRSHVGVPPWFISAWALDTCDWQPAEPHKRSGMEGSIHRGLMGCDVRWLYHDPHDLARVDFKTAANMTRYEQVAGTLGIGPELVGTEAWTSALLDRYPPELVGMAAATSWGLRNDH